MVKLMPIKVDSFPLNLNVKTAKIRPMSIKRDWVAEEVSQSNAYSCLPLTLANSMGYELYFDEDIDLLWNGKDVEVFAGKDFCHFDRGAATVGISTNLIFHSEPNVSMITMPVPNTFVDGVHVYSSIISTSFFTSPLHIVLRLTIPNKRILIESGKAIASILPASISEFNNSVINMHNSVSDKKMIHVSSEYNNALGAKVDLDGRPAGWYQNGIDHKGNKIGSHEIKRFSFRVESE